MKKRCEEPDEGGPEGIERRHNLAFNRALQAFTPQAPLDGASVTRKSPEPREAVTAVADTTTTITGSSVPALRAVCPICLTIWHPAKLIEHLCMAHYRDVYRELVWAKAQMGLGSGAKSPPASAGPKMPSRKAKAAKKAGGLKRSSSSQTADRPLRSPGGSSGTAWQRMTGLNPIAYRGGLPSLGKRR